MYFKNVNEGNDYTPLQSCLSVERFTGSMDVIGNAELLWLRVLWGSGEGGGGGEQNLHELKKNKKKHFWASDFYLFPLSH